MLYVCMPHYRYVHTISKVVVVFIWKNYQSKFDLKKNRDY